MLGGDFKKNQIKEGARLENEQEKGELLRI